MTVPDGNVVVGNKKVSDIQSNISLTPAEDTFDEEGITSLKASGDVYRCTDFEYNGAPTNANLIAFKVMKDETSTFVTTPKDSSKLSIINEDQSSGVVVLNIIQDDAPLAFSINVSNNGVLQHVFEIDLSQVSVLL